MASVSRNQIALFLKKHQRCLDRKIRNILGTTLWHQPIDFCKITTSPFLTWPFRTLSSSSNKLNDAFSETATSESVWLQKKIRRPDLPRDVAYAERILETIKPPAGAVILDMTFGSGGLSDEFLKRNPGTKVISVDRDPVTRADADRLRAKYPNRLCYLNLKFSEVPDALYAMGILPSSFWGAVLDAGPSIEQLTQPQRGGFCYTNSEPLDLRMDGPDSNNLSALDVLRTADYETLRMIFRSYGQSDQANEIADAVVKSRYTMTKIESTADFVNFICNLIGGNPLANYDATSSSPTLESPPVAPLFSAVTHSMNRDQITRGANRIIQALRIFVNNEANELDCAVRGIHHFLRPNAPFAVITYNSLEHSIVKKHFAGLNVDTQPVIVKNRPKKNVAQQILRPWKMETRMVTRWKQTVRHPQWLNMELRIARKIPGVMYTGDGHKEEVNAEGETWQKKELDPKRFDNVIAGRVMYFKSKHGYEPIK